MPSPKEGLYYNLIERGTLFNVALTRETGWFMGDQVSKDMTASEFFETCDAAAETLRRRAARKFEASKK